MSDWKEYTVKELIDLGMIDKPMDGNHGGIHPKTTDYVPVGVPFIMANNLIDGGVDFETCSFITEEQANTLKKGFAKPGDVLLTHKATMGRTAIVPDDYPIIILTPQVTYYRIRKGINRSYLKYYFDSSDFQNTLASWSNSGSTRAYLGITAQQKLPIILPPIELQNKIASILLSIDNKIKNNKAINRNLEDQANAIYKSWFVDFDNNNYKRPVSWIDGAIDDVASLVSRGITPKYVDDSDERVINQRCIRNHVIDLSIARTHNPKRINEKWLCYGDLLLNSTGTGTLGRAAQVWFEPKNLTVDSHVTIVRPKSSEWVFYVGLWGLNNEREIEALHTGSTGQTELPRARVKTMPIILPDRETLTRLNEIVLPITTKIMLNQKENTRLAQLRDSVLPKLMSGEIDVSDLDI